jgi:hypothetical protein
VVGFPLYDGHGNMVGTLMRSGSGYSLNDRRTYDAWAFGHWASLFLSLKEIGEG